MYHMVIARSLFRRLVATEKAWRTVLLNAEAYPTREDALAAIDELPDYLLWMPGCDQVSPDGKCLGHPRT